jgi:hypothetical protein
MEDDVMKKNTLITGIASLAALVAALWSAPVATSSGVAAAHQVHNWFSGHPNEHFSDVNTADNDNDEGTVNDNDQDDPGHHGVPEPGMLALFAVGLTGLGAVRLLRRKRVKA